MPAADETLLATCDGVDIVAIVSSAEAAAEAARTQRPDIAFIDLAVTGGAIAALQGVLAGRPGCSACLVAASERALPEHADALVAAIQLGARGYIVEDAPAAEWVLAVESLAGHGAVITPEFARDLVTALDWPWLDAIALGRSASSEGTRHLTSVERQILLATGNGLTPTEIAHQLRLSNSHVRATLRGVLEKFRQASSGSGDELGDGVPRRPAPGGLRASAAAAPESDQESATTAYLQDDLYRR
jgi:DNA-binding NarL/FixJ family response regulator